MPKNKDLVAPKDRKDVLKAIQNTKMADSAHAFMRGNTKKFYEWLESSHAIKVPVGPSVWICGDCHVGNLGPIADANGKIEIQIRDLDQAVIGNPAHDLLRLGLSLATAARGSDLPGLVTVQLIEHLIEGYESAFLPESDLISDSKIPVPIKLVMKISAQRSWKELAKDRLEDIEPSIPLGKRFWPLTKEEEKAINALFKEKKISKLATLIKHRNDDDKVSVLDAAFWQKGCSSLGNLRYSVLLDVGKASEQGDDLCLIDIKEATTAIAPRDLKAEMPKDNAERVFTAAKHLSPYLGERMIATRLLGKSVFIRELLPQDLKVELEQLTPESAMNVAYYLAKVVGKAHARQMNEIEKEDWLKILELKRSKALDAPSWLWDSLVELIGLHERAYLEHCRKCSNLLKVKS